MIDQLNEVIKSILPTLFDDPKHWQSLIIDRRKPITHRVFTLLGDQRLCLHKFEQFDTDSEEGFFHPHPWRGAFRIVEGAYRMEVGHTPDRIQDKPELLYTTELTAGSSYEILHPLVWHRVIPITPVVYTIMLNDLPWTPEEAHTQVRTTKGKDLKKMSDDQLREHLDFFLKALYR